jgi:hypothetical protein
VSDNCFICETPDDGTCICDRCARAYDRATKNDDGTIVAAMIWAARRARKFERARAAIERGPVVRKLGEGRMSAVKP